jgi:hypothetical protein
MFLIDVSELTYGSQKRVPVECDFNISPNCKLVVITEYKAILITMNKHDGKYICKSCSTDRHNNSRSKYLFDDGFFENIDSPEKAYILGWIASDGSIRHSGFTIKIHKKDLAILEILRYIICKELPINEYRENMVELTVNSQKMSTDLCKWLKLPFTKDSSHKKSDIVQFPDLKTKKLKWHFLRGYVDGDGSVFTTKDSKMPGCNITSDSKIILEQIHDFCNIICCINDNKLKCNGQYAVQFLNKLYEDKQNLYLERKYNRYFDFKDWFPYQSKNLKQFKYTRLISKAVKPKKQNNIRGKDIWHLELIKKIKEKDDIIYYDTCVKIEPKPGYKLTLKPIQDIYELGYDLINEDEIIDGKTSIKAKLMKIDPDIPDLELPIKLVAIVVTEI